VALDLGDQLTRTWREHKRDALWGVEPRHRVNPSRHIILTGSIPTEKTLREIVKSHTIAAPLTHCRLAKKA
jgi:hypothetical protein